MCGSQASTATNLPPEITSNLSPFSPPFVGWSRYLDIRVMTINVWNTQGGSDWSSRFGRTRQTIGHVELRAFGYPLLAHVEKRPGSCSSVRASGWWKGPGRRIVPE